MCVVASCVRRVGCVPWSVASGGSLGNPGEAILGRFWDLLGLDGGTLSSKTAQESGCDPLWRVVGEGTRSSSSSSSWSGGGLGGEPLGNLLGACWAFLGASGEPPGSLSKGFWEPLGGILGASGGSLGTSRGGKLERSVRDALWAPYWGRPGALLGRLGRLLGRLGALLGRLGSLFGDLGAVSGPLGPSWGVGSSNRREFQKQ